MHTVSYFRREPVNVAKELVISLDDDRLDKKVDFLNEGDLGYIQSLSHVHVEEFLGGLDLILRRFSLLEGLVSSLHKLLRVHQDWVERLVSDVVVYLSVTYT